LYVVPIRARLICQNWLHGSLGGESNHDWQNMTRLPITGRVMERAAGLARHKLRGADAVHLATALDLRGSFAGINDVTNLLFPSPDYELLEAAKTAGLRLKTRSWRQHPEANDPHSQISHK
jgi:hypothetical protein